MGPYCLSSIQSFGIAFQWGRRSGVLVTHSLYDSLLLENFQMLLRDPQRVTLFIFSKLFIFVFEISNPGGPLFSMTFLFCFVF